MSDYESQIDELMYEASGLPYGPTKISLIEEAARVADVHNDVDLGYEIRSELMDAALFSGRIDVLLVTFAWSLAQFDRHPDRFDEWDLLWKYKWVTHQTHCFPSIPREKMEEMLMDMERRFRAGGHSLHGVAQKRRDLYLDMNDLEAAKEAHAAYKKTKVDSLSDCAACTRACDGDYYAALRKWKQQLKTLEPVLEGRLTCAEQPLNSASKAMITLLRLGQVEEAKELQLKYFKQLTKNRDNIVNAARHVTFLSLVGEPAKAKRVFEKFLPEAMTAVTRSERMELLCSGVVLLDRLAQKSKAVKLAAHPEFPAPDAKGQHEIASLREWMMADVLKIAAAYDARNGNDGETRRMQELPELIEELAVA